MSDYYQKDAQDALNRGIEYTLKGDYEKGIKEFTEAIKLDPLKSEYYLNRGMNFANLNQHEEAIEDLTEAIKLEPNDYKSYRTRGMSYFNLDQFDQALKDLNETLKINPNDYIAYMSLGLVYICKGDKLNDVFEKMMYFKSAKENFEKVLTLNPDNTTLNHAKNSLNKIKFYLISENAEKFFTDYQNIINVHYSHYLISYKMNDKQTNINIITNSAQMIQFAGAIGYQIRAYGYVGNGDLINAITDFTAAINDLPDTANFYQDRGIVYGEKGDFDKSIKDLNKALQLKSDSADCYYYRSLAYMCEGDFEHAFSDCEKALELNFQSSTTHLDAYLLSGFFYANNGDFNKAINNFENALQINLKKNSGDLNQIESIFYDNARICLEYARRIKTNSEFVKQLQRKKEERELIEINKRKQQEEKEKKEKEELELRNAEERNRKRREEEEKIRKSKAEKPLRIISMLICIISSIFFFYSIYIVCNISVIVGSVINGCIICFLMGICFGGSVAGKIGIGIFIGVCGGLIGLLLGWLTGLLGGIKIIWAIVTFLFCLIPLGLGYAEKK